MILVMVMLLLFATNLIFKISSTGENLSEMTFRLLWNILRAMSRVQKRGELGQVGHLVLLVGLLHALHPRTAPQAGGQGQVQH